LAKLDSSDLSDSVKQEVLKRVEAQAKKMGYDSKKKKSESKEEDVKKDKEAKEDKKEEKGKEKSLEKTTAPMNCPECY
jgi:chromatin remodeling complex protein RSC6